MAANIRVLGHEIRNSLTPVIGMAENLAVKLTEPRQAQALNVISERCNHLNEFVTRYGNINKALSLNIVTIDSQAFLIKFALFTLMLSLLVALIAQLLMPIVHFYIK